MSEVHVFSSAAFNYIPKVRMLFQSIRTLHPEWTIHLALADELRSGIDLSQEPIDRIWPAAELEIPRFRSWAFFHSIVEFATAIKPYLLCKLLREPGCRKVIYLDPDIVLFSRLDDVLEALERSDYVLTPHQTKPERSLDAVIDNEICSLKHGVYNLGFLGVSATDGGLEFAEWWRDRIYHFCRADIPNGLFTDQRWIDLAPAFFSGVEILRSSRLNVATWNLTTRNFRKNSSGEYFVDEAPLGFYHFTGFDSGAHKIMAEKNAGTNKAVHELIDWYEHETKALSHDPLAQVPWAYGSFADRSPITRDHREIYRDRLDLQNAFPDPFVDGYAHWWSNRASIEYPHLFKERSRQEVPRAPQQTNLSSLLRHAITQPRTGWNLGKRGIRLLRSEGWSGVFRRLRA